MESKLYMAYGANTNLKNMAHRCPTARRVGIGKINDFELVFRGGVFTAVANVEPKKDSIVDVLLWELLQADERALDLFEGYPNKYRKETMKVITTNGIKTDAMIYIMNEGPSLGIPSFYYYDCLKEGYEAAGFDLQVLERAITKGYESIKFKDTPLDEDSELKQS